MNTPSEAELLDIIGDFYDCAIEPSHWPVALERLAGLVGGCESAVAFHSFTRPEFQLPAKWNINPEFERAMLENFAISPMIPLAVFSQIDQPQSAFRAIGEVEIKQGRWYAQTLGKHGYGDALLTLLARSSTQFVGLSVLRRSDQPYFDAHDAAIVRPLCPHIRRATQIADLLDARALESRTLSATLELLQTAVLMTDDKGRETYANATARRLVEGADALTKSHGTISARDPASAAELRQAIADACNGATVDVPSTGVTVTLASSAGRDLVAWVLPLDGGLRRDLGATYAARTAIFVRELGDTSPFPAELFVRRYGISPAECRLLILLVQGMTLQQATETLGIAKATAKTQLSQLFAKTGTSGQADLMRLAVSALAPAHAP